MSSARTVESLKQKAARRKKILQAEQVSLQPFFTGSRYEAVVPDTLDLAERAALAVNGMGGSIDPELDYVMTFLVNYGFKTPYRQHHTADITCGPKFSEALPLMRLMCGSDQYAEDEVHHRAELLSRIEDGLFWNYADPRTPWFNTYIAQFDRERKQEDVANPAAAGIFLHALVTWRKLTGNSQWDTYIQELWGGLNRIVIKCDDYAYFPDGGFGEAFNYPRSGYNRTDEPKGETEGAEGSVVVYQGKQAHALLRWYAVSGDEQAFDLAERLVRFCMKPKFWGGVPDPNGDRSKLPGQIGAGAPDPACIAGHEMGHWYSHFHARSVALRAILEYGRITGDPRALEFVRRAYEYSMTCFAIPRIGWINCLPAAASGNLCEGCGVGELVAYGVHLSGAGLGDYWDDVDAVIRNHLVEQQVTRTDLIERIAANSGPIDPKAFAPKQILTEDVIARTRGVWFGNSLPNAVTPGWTWSMGCCTYNCAMGLFHAWNEMVRESGDSAEVNLLLNRATKSLDVDSYLPYEGKVVVHNKSNRRISVRMPGWVRRQDVRASVSGTGRPNDWLGRHLVFGDLKPGDKITVQFPIMESTAGYTAAYRTKEEQTYTVSFRGSTVVGISPREERATAYPFYDRDHLRQNKTPMKKIRQFVPERALPW